MGCCCCWRTRPASGLFAPTSRSTPARCRQQPGGHIALLPSHWQTAACTLQPVWGLGAFGRAAAVAVVPGSWFEPWPGNSGPLAMWAAARGRASPLSVSCRPWGPGAQTPRLSAGLVLRPPRSRRASAGTLAARVVSRPSLLWAWAECVFLGNLGSTFLSDSCFATRVSRCCLCAELGTGCVWCGSWTWPCLQVLKRLGAERPGRVIYRQWAHQGSARAGNPGRPGLLQQSAQRPPQGTKKGTGGRSLWCVGRDGSSSGAAGMGRRVGARAPAPLGTLLLAVLPQPGEGPGWGC